jgi:hypothetical protein
VEGIVQVNFAVTRGNGAYATYTLRPGSGNAVSPYFYVYVKP